MAKKPTKSARPAKKAARKSRKRGAKKAAKSAENPPASEKRGLTDEEIDLALITGDHRAELERLFGVEDYAELRQLALSARQVKVRGGATVLILPGILGSKLGCKRGFFNTWDELWLDFKEVILCNLTDLSLEGEKDLKPFGVMLLFYLKLKFRLRRAGFKAEFYPYDWRRGIDVLGKQLAKHVKGIGKPVSLVAHSMGGLVSRSALATLGEDSPKAVEKLIMLGTPNHGSYVPVEVFRGTSATLRKLDKLDTCHDVEELVDEAFATIDGLIQMMPFKELSPNFDFFDEDQWPTGKLRPRPKRLKEGPKVQRLLGKVSENDLKRCYLIAGIDQETIVGATLNDGEFQYEYSREGDGTVPLKSAELPGIQETYYIEEAHGSLPNNKTVAKAVVDLIRTGATERLPTEWTRTMERTRTLTRGESELREIPIDLEPGEEPASEEKRHLLEEFLAPSRDGQVSSQAMEMPGLESLSRQPVVIGRRRQKRLDVSLAHGDITAVNSQAIILGIFDGVAPSGAARALDEALDGEISQIRSRRLFSANAGEVFVLPVSRRMLGTDFIVFVGLGYYDEFSKSVLEMAAKNTARILLSAQISDFATVAMGSASATDLKDSLRSMLRGFSAGMQEAGEGQHIRSLTVVEYDEKRFQQMTRSLVELAVSDILDGIEITIDTQKLESRLIRTAKKRGEVTGPDPLYLIVRQHSSREAFDTEILQASLLTAGGKATVVSEEIEFSLSELNALLKKLAGRLGMKEVKELGAELSEIVLPKPIRHLLVREGQGGSPLVVLHDADSSRIPWEMIRLPEEGGEEFVPALAGGLSRRFMTDVPVAKWMSSRQQSNTLELLLVVDPTSDLPGAEEEGARIQTLLKDNPSINITTLMQGEASHGRLLDELSSGEYDVVHYAGHAFFDANNRSRSGLLCSDRQVLSGADLAGIGQLPTLMIFNACEAGRIRSIHASEEERPGIDDIVGNVSLSEAFLRGGVANFIGTYWPVGDIAAKEFAMKFYEMLLNGAPLGDAITESRMAIHGKQSKDWADYMHYGDVNFRLKDRS